MKGKIILGSILAVLIIAVVPATNAIEFQTETQTVSEAGISYQQIQQMTAEELIVYIQSIAYYYPEVSAQFLTAVHNLENTPVTSDQQSAVMIEKTKGTQPGAANQTLLEKIYWKIYNYRILRLLISLVFFLKFQSKFTLLRSTTWAIRVLRWVKLGILLGYINPSQNQTQTPNIVFQQDLVNDTLTVTSLSAADVLWSDIAEIGQGSCDPFPAGTVTVGEMITNCTGIIVLQYLPTTEVLGVFEFD